ncbi:hypothetical protein RDABS01_037586 [Bienertia sinuspersici]
MGRAPCCDKNGLKKGPWTPEEDQKLIDYIQNMVMAIGELFLRCWTSKMWEELPWSAIAARLPGRTDNEIKNYWNTHIRKRLLRMGIDPVTHSPRLDLLDLSSILSNSSLYNNTSSQMDMSRLLGFQPLVNPELLKLATSLLSNQHQNNFQGNDNQMQNNYNPMLQTTQIQAPIQNPLPNCTTMTNTATPTTDTATLTDTSNQTGVPFFDEAQLMGPSFEQYPTNIPNFDAQNLDHLQSNGLSMPNIQPTNAFGYYGTSHQTFMDPSLSSNHTFQSNGSEGHHQSFFNYGPSVMSTPSSSPTPLNSSSNSTTYVNSSGTENSPESYCNEMMKFEIPDILDVNQFLLAQSN